MELIPYARTGELQFLRQIFVRDQMAEWSQRPLIMARADGVCYWDIHDKRYLDAISGIYVASLGHNVRCLGKGLGGGYAPISAMICRREIADVFWGPPEENPGFVEGHTFEGNPISCAAAIAVLREILERDLLQHVREQGVRLRAAFERLAAKYDCIGDIRGKGLFQAIEFVSDRAARSFFLLGKDHDRQLGREAFEQLARVQHLLAADPHGAARQVDRHPLDARLALERLFDREHHRGAIGIEASDLGHRNELGAGNNVLQLQFGISYWPAEATEFSPRDKTTHRHRGAVRL
jgi:4-aminobutyrate aminotransferase-like enzyme